MTQQPPPPDYYLNYFRRMIDTVEQRYADLLDDSDLAYLQALNNASNPAIRLLVRLYMRKGPNFFSDKLNYPEVADRQAAIEELAHAGLIIIDPEVFVFELIEILPIAVSRQQFPADDPKIRKADLLELWLEDDELRACTGWGVEEEIITPANYDSYRKIQLLYFGSEQQTLTDFILEDLGLFQYENYQLDIENRYFNSAMDIAHSLQISDLNRDFYLMQENRDWSSLPEFAQQALALQPSDALAPRWHRLLNRIGYRLEQQGELELALAVMQTNQQPPARERCCRIYSKLNRPEQAKALLADIHAQPLSSDESAFYRRFINKVQKQLGEPAVALKKLPITEIRACWERTEGSVEQQACRHFGNAVWLENQLPLAIFGLIHWPIIFADTAGVWHHPFQSAPSDLYDSEFARKRATELNAIAALDHSDMRQQLIHYWQQKHNLRNPFVSWGKLELETLLMCFDALTAAQWHGLFKHLLQDLRHHRSGFPDLFQRTDEDYRFIEIKGPGDKLQDNQVGWLQVFAELEINAVVCYVSYETTEL